MSHHSDTLLWFRVDQSMNVASLRHIIMIPCRPVYKCRITRTHYYDSVSTSLWMSHHSDTLLWFRVDQSINVASLRHIIMIRVDQSINVASLRHIIMIPCRSVYECRITQTHYYDSVSTSLLMSHHSDTLLWFGVDQSINVALLEHIIMIPCRPVYKCRITQTHYYDSVSTSLLMSHHSDTLLWFRVDQSINVTSLRPHYYDSVPTSL